MKTMLEIERKFLIKKFLLNAKAANIIFNSESARIKQWYLPKDSLDRTSRVRSKYQLTENGPVNTYFFTRKKQIAPGVSKEEEKEIDFKTFSRYLKKIDPKKKPIEKTRYYLPWDGKVFELDVFHGFNQGLVILEIELNSIDEAVQLPPYLDVRKEVTYDKSYSNKSLASKSKSE